MKRSIIISVLICTLLSTIIYFTLNKNRDKNNIEKLVAQVSETVRAEYFREINPEPNFRNAYRKLLNTIDPMATYLTEQETEKYMKFRKGEIFFSGIYGYMKGGAFYISTVLKPGSASEKGIVPGDMIHSVNGESLFFADFWTSHLRMTSMDKNATLSLEIQKKGKRERETVKITFNKNKPHNSFSITDSLLSAKLRVLDRECADELKRIINNTEIRSIEVDLRNYIRGTFNDTITIAKLLSDKPCYLIREKKTGKTKISIKPQQKTLITKKLIIDNSSFLHSALLAAILKDTGYKTEGSTVLSEFSIPGHFILKDKTSILIPQEIIKFSDRKFISEITIREILKRKKTS